MARKEEPDYKKDLKKIGENIRRIRLEKNMKQKELADACDFDRQNMNRIEAGKNNVTYKTLLTIAKALDVSVIDLLNI